MKKTSQIDRMAADIKEIKESLARFLAAARPSKAEAARQAKRHQALIRALEMGDPDPGATKRITAALADQVAYDLKKKSPSRVRATRRGVRP